MNSTRKIPSIHVKLHKIREYIQRRQVFMGGKTNPLYPPLTGGYEKATRPRQDSGPHRAEGVLLFLAPLSRGGRGGCLYGVSLSRGLPLPSQGLFQQPLIGRVRTRIDIAPRSPLSPQEHTSPQNPHSENFLTSIRRFVGWHRRIGHGGALSATSAPASTHGHFPARRGSRT